MATNTGDDYRNEIYNDNGGDPDYSKHRENYPEAGNHGKPASVETWCLGIMILATLVFVPLLVFNLDIGTAFVYFMIMAPVGGMWLAERKPREEKK
jgi:hypothetical protein